MRVLITGALGFVGPYFAEAARRTYGGGVSLFATGKTGGQHPILGACSALDVTDRGAVDAAVAKFEPTHFVHLAGLAAPTAANADPDAAWRVHVHGAINVAQAILDRAPGCRLIHVGSGLVYGESAKSGRPLDETTVLAPLDDYAVTKAAGDLAVGALARRGLRCIRFRPFNHTGPGQSEVFVVPAFAMQIARIEAGLAPPIIRVGNLDAERDFLDVRDVACAYARALRHGENLEAGAILNIASGEPRRIGDLLQRLVARSHVKITIEQDPARLRPSDLPIIVGNANRARASLDWRPEYAFEDTLERVLNHCRSRSGSE